VLGLYNAGYMLTITYAGMVFSAMETDFFPRLSGVNNDIEATNYTVNRQMEVSLLIVAPMLTALIALLPVLIPQLFTSEFLPVVPMAQVAALAMFFKVLTLPVAYITLARGYSMSYLMLESAYFVVFVLLVVIGYQHWGLFGTGVAITLAHVFDYLMINLYAYKKYGYRVSVTVSRYAVVLLSLGCLAYACTILLDGIVYWLVELIIVLASGLYMFQNLKSSSTSTKL
jgi:O-antigen/teichoic acid export membrane protein